MNKKNKQEQILPNEDFAEKNPLSEENEYSLDFSVVGIGASAGGLEALQEFFNNTPDNPGVAFVLVQHLSPDYKSLMDELLARYTGMKIHRVTDGMEIQPNHIYLITPRKNMTIFRGKLFLTEQDHTHKVNMPIDIFMRSLAQDQGKNAIGVILSGTGSDGTLGIRAIKENGGMVIAQDDRSAKFDGMPRSSISTGMVDYILTPEEMAEALINYVKHPFIQKTEKIENQITKDEDYLSKIIMIIRDVTGIDFSNYKESTIIRRLEKRISINRYDKIEDYVDFISSNRREVNILYKELLIGVTRFFRDDEAFAKLKEKVIPELLNGKKREPLRIWCVGCSTGEEAYSLAIYLKEFMDENSINREVKLFATDIDRDSIEFAGAGIYPESIVSDVSAEHLSRYFTRKQDGFQINESIRSMVVFASHNILKDPPFSKIDLVSCRNMLIYLNNDVQQKVLSMLYFSLNKDGYLFLGSSESVGEISGGFNALDTKAKIYKILPGYKPPANEFFRVPNLQKRQRDLKSVGTYFDKAKPKVHKLENIFDELLSEFIPPSVIVDENYNIVHTIHNVNKFLNIPTGQISLNILKMLPDELSTMVSSIMRRARKNKQEVVYENIRLQSLDGQMMTVSGRMLNDKKFKEIYYIISFQVKEKTKAKADDTTIEKVDVDSQYQERINELEKELQYTKENLQATVEELETSNEELQSSNEELIASNEELQSTNEELQSVNEELYTVNAEHQDKIEELTQLNNDMNNLLKNTNIGTLFIDSQLRIRKITDIAAKITNIRDSDVGRPIDHISLDHIYKNFIEDINEVLENLQQKETEITKEDGTWYLLRILPYRTAENAVDGIIVTFIDITRLKKIEKEKDTTYELIYKTLEYNPVASTIVDESGAITFANKKAESLFGITQKQIRERNFDDLKWEITDMEENQIPSDDLPFSRVMKTHKPIYRYQHYIKIPQKEKRLLSINGAPMYNQEGKVNGVVFTLEDVTELKKAEIAIKESEEKYRSLFNSNMDAILVADENRKIIDANPALEEMFGYQLKEIKGKKTSYLYAQVHDFDDMGEYLEDYSKGFVQMISYKTKSGKIFYGETSAFQLKDANGKVKANVGLIRDITQRMQAESRRKMWEHTVNSISESIFLLDEEYNILQYNQAFLDLLNKKEEDIKGKKSYELIHGADNPPEYCVTCKGLSDKKITNDEFWEPHLKKYLRISIDPVYGKGGNFEFAVEKIQDISAEKNIKNNKN